MSRNSRIRWAPLATSLTLVALASCEPDGQQNVAAIRGQTVDCAQLEGERYVGIEFSASPDLSWLSEFALYRYTYADPGTNEPVLGEGPYPRQFGPGGIPVQDPPTEQQSTAKEGAPPTALIPISQAVTDEFVFADLSLINEHEVSIKADSLDDLLGRSISTPLGQTVVTDVTNGPDSVDLELSYTWMNSLVDHSSLQPHGNLNARLSIGDIFSPAFSQAADDGVEVFAFEFPRVERGDSHKLTLGQFEVVASGPALVEVKPNICSQA